MKCKKTSLTTLSFLCSFLFRIRPSNFEREERGPEEFLGVLLNNYHEVLPFKTMSYV
jgi:hypothetical protein